MVRKVKMKHLMTTGMVDRESRINRQAQRKDTTERMAHWLYSANVAKLLTAAREKETWRNKVASKCGTTIVTMVIPRLFNEISRELNKWLPILVMRQFFILMVDQELL